MIDWVSHGAIWRASGGRSASAGAARLVVEREPVDRAAGAGDDHRGAEPRAPDRLEARQELGMGDDQPRIGIVDHVFENPAAVGEIDRHVDRAEIVEPEPDAQCVGAIGQPGQNGVALLDTQAAESRRGSTGGLARLAIGPGAPSAKRAKTLSGVSAARRSRSGRSTQSTSAGTRRSCHGFAIRPSSLVRWIVRHLSVDRVTSSRRGSPQSGHLSQRRPWPGCGLRASVPEGSEIGHRGSEL